MFALSIDNNHSKVVARSPATCGTDCQSSPKQNEAWRSLATRPRALGPRANTCCRASTPEAAAPEKSGDQFHREHQCSNQPDPDKPQRKPFAPRELSRAMFGLVTAKSIASKAYMNLGHRDPYHLKKAEKTFKQPVSFETLDQHVTMIRSVLDRLVIDRNLLAATCDEKQCNDGTHNAVGVTLDDLSAVLLCPFFFMQPGTTLATTILHEAGHMANIDVNYVPGGETYCRPDDTIPCDDICPLSGENLLENVDAWMRFIYCIALSS